MQRICGWKGVRSDENHLAGASELQITYSIVCTTDLILSQSNDKIDKNRIRYAEIRSIANR